MRRFIDKHQAAITGTISRFDRILFKGRLSLGWSDAVVGFISHHGMRIKDFGRSVSSQSERVSRLLKRLHVHGLIAKITRSRRWRVTHKGHSVMTTMLTLHHEHYPQLLARRAA